ncbi:MAG: hypothetical protein U0U46_18310 [Saprospiraceae bacterium]
MTTVDNRAELKRLAEALTGNEGSPGHWFAAGNALYELFRGISGLDERDETLRSDLLLPEGKAISPVWAAHCIKDSIRTRVFLRGILAAIEEARRRFPGGRIHILYAGCGPFASLLLPLVPFLEKDSVEFTLLDALPKNIDLAGQMVAAFHAEPFVREMVVADAASYPIDPAAPVHIVVAEMMQAGLQSEPQVAAVANLAQGIKAGGILVPQRVAVQAGLMHPALNMRRMTDPDWQALEVFRLLEPGFALTADPADWLELRSGAEKIIPLPAGRDAAYSQLALFTTLKVFGKENLNVWDAALTQPLLLHKLAVGEQVEALALRYVCGGAPGFQFRLL